MLLLLLLWVWGQAEAGPLPQHCTPRAGLAHECRGRRVLVPGLLLFWRTPPNIPTVHRPQFVLLPGKGYDTVQYSTVQYSTVPGQGVWGEAEAGPGEQLGLAAGVGHRVPPEVCSG